MRIKIKLLISLFMIVLIITGSECDKTQSPPSTNCPDNNTFECATQLTLGIGKQDNIATNDDVDMFQFNLPQDGVTEIAVTNVPTNINLDVRLYNSNQWEIASSTTTGLGQSVYILKGQNAGAGYIRIEDRDHNASSNSLYTVMVTEDISDSYELNENSSIAKLIQQNTTLQAKFRPNDDYDWFQFSTPQGGVIDISIWNVPSNINIFTELYDNYVWGLISSENNGLGQGVTLSIARKQGLHYLRINDQNRDASSTSYYNFFAYLDISDVYEYNNTIQDAKSMSLNSNYQAKIRPKNDLDYFQFILTSAGNITVNVTNVPSNIDMDVSICYSSGYEFTGSYSTGNGQPVIFTVNNLQAGTYYVKFEDGDHDATSTQFYNFRINN